MSSFRIAIIVDRRNARGFTLTTIFEKAMEFLYSEIDKHQLDINHDIIINIGDSEYKFVMLFDTPYGQIRFETKSEPQLRQIIHEICEYREFDSVLHRDINNSYTLIVNDAMLDLCIARVNVYFVEPMIVENKSEIVDIIAVDKHTNTATGSIMSSNVSIKPKEINDKDIEMLIDAGRALGVVIDNLKLKDIDDSELSAMGLEGKRMIQTGLMLIKKSLYKDTKFC